MRPARQAVMIDILVAAHNEESVILPTLAALVGALKNSRIPGRILVGLDHCSDATAELVAKFAPVSDFPIVAIENPGQAGKWHLLKLLISQSQAEWVALVDSGSIWDPALLVEALPLLASVDVMGVAPSYLPSKSGMLERLNWKLERWLKSGENEIGGPVSVHGATVLYRRRELIEALRQMEGTHWLNDDVALPLTMRLSFPRYRIAYLDDPARPAFVRDLGIRGELDLEYRRRRRMILGNLQWISRIWLPRMHENRGVSLAASRRVFRLFWAYWITLIVVGTFMTIASTSAPVTLIALALALVLSIGGYFTSSWVRRLMMAFLSGLQVPLYWKEMNGKGQGVLWS
ncbi:MAG: glycosyltransferase [Bdellovibrionota bacterium]